MTEHIMQFFAFEHLPAGLKEVSIPFCQLAEQIVKTLPNEVVIGSNVPYAGTHQNGTRHVPARPFLPVKGRIPPAYMPAIGLAAARGVARAVVLLLGGRPA